MENKKIIIYSYTKVWNVEKKIYNAGNIRLPVPVEMWSAICFAGTAFGMYILQKIFPGLLQVPVVVRLGVVPYGFMYFMRRVKLDGKNPIRYFVDFFRYLLCDRHCYLEHFARHGKGRERIALDWSCSMAYRQKGESICMDAR